MQLGDLEAVHVEPSGKRRGSPVLLLHGMGLGAWIWERHQRILAEKGLESWAVDLPGHGADAGRDVSLEDVLQAAERAASALAAPALVGLGMGSLVAQVLAHRMDPASAVLVAPIPPAGLRALPSRDLLNALAPSLPGALMGRALSPGRPSAEVALQAVPEGEREALLARMTPWPARLTRDLMFNRPEIPHDGIRCPVLITFGLRDKAVRLSTVRLLGDYYNALTWRFDDLSHLPPVEPGGDRHAEKVAGWLLRPKRKLVDEVDAFAPSEGVGQELRDQRRQNRRQRTHLEGSPFKGNQAKVAPRD